VLILVMYLTIVLPAMALVTANPKRTLLMALMYLPLALLSTPPLEMIWVALVPVSMLDVAVRYGKVSVKHLAERRTLALAYVLFGSAASVLLMTGDSELASFVAGPLAAFAPLLLARSFAAGQELQ
jgi:hypothetical protein